MKRDTEQFLSLVTSSQASLFAYILSLVPSVAHAEDLLQETNLVLWRKAEQFEAGTSFIAWACQIAYFNVLSWRRRMARDRHVFSDELLDYLAERQSERMDAEDARRRALAGCIEKLAPAHREVIRRRYEPGASVQQIAAAMGKTEGALSQLLLRIRTTLLRCIETSVAGDGGAA